MKSNKTKIRTEKLTQSSISDATKLVVKLWPDCSFKEEYKRCKNTIKSKVERIHLAKIKDEIVGFIYLRLRTDYVEGTTTSPVAYIEGIYIKPKYRKKGIAELLVRYGENWGRKRGAKDFGSDTELTNSVSIDFHKNVGFKEANRIVCFAKKIK